MDHCEHTNWTAMDRSAPVEGKTMAFCDDCGRIFVSEVVVREVRSRMAAEKFRAAQRVSTQK